MSRPSSSDPSDAEKGAPQRLPSAPSSTRRSRSYASPAANVTKPLLSRAFIADPNAAFEAAHRVAKRLNELSEDDCLWHGEVVPGEGLVFSRNGQGVNERHLTDAALLMRL